MPNGSDQDRHEVSRWLVDAEAATSVSESELAYTNETGNHGISRSLREFRTVARIGSQPGSIGFPSRRCHGRRRQGRHVTRYQKLRECFGCRQRLMDARACASSSRRNAMSISLDRRPLPEAPPSSRHERRWPSCPSGVAVVFRRDLTRHRDGRRPCAAARGCSLRGPGTVSLAVQDHPVLSSLNRTSPRDGARECSKTPSELLLRT
jgi:hypothetical protein